MKSILIRTIMVAGLLGLFMISEITAQQLLSQPVVSPKASVTQDVGLATIEITYGRPGVKGREIWGKLVPYGTEEQTIFDQKPMPWRAGANENSTISLSHDAKINGQSLPAGTYGIHMIVNENEWTIIFSKDYNSFGSFFYNEANDALRVKATPVEAPFQEWMMFGFDKLTGGSCEAFLQWEKIKVPFTIEFDQHKIVTDTYKVELMGNPGFFANEWRNAARYCLNNNVYLDLGLEWADQAYKAFRIDKFSVDVVKAGLLKATGKTAEAKKLLDEAMETASEKDLTDYGRTLFGAAKWDDMIYVAKFTVDKYSDSWNAYFMGGIAYASKGDKENAKDFYEEALDLAPENMKARIQTRLEAL
ncbi:DUF2911 domain-containing protein [Bacteroidota bacterium]